MLKAWQKVPSLKKLSDILIQIKIHRKRGEMAMKSNEFYEVDGYICAVCDIPGYTDFCKEEENRNNKIWWTTKIDNIGELNISFDRKKIYNLFKDYPYNMTKEEVEIFKKEEPYWANFFSWRTVAK